MISEVAKIKRKVWTEIAALAFEDKLEDEIEFLPRKLTREGITNYRCCEFKERAILADRIKLTLGIDLRSSNDDERLLAAAKRALDRGAAAPEPGRSLINIIEKACDRCPIDRIVVTDACRNCVAHYCVNACRRRAIEIVGNRAHIDRERCVECGLCVKACQFGAIIERERPCSRACAAGAIKPGRDSSAEIDYSKCIECGACITACPFGAISDTSDILRVITMLKSKDTVVIALVAPSVVGQFGPMAGWDALEKGLVHIGFAEVFPVAVAADVVAREEGRELAERMAGGNDIMFNSCCPAFVRLIDLHFPCLSEKVSKTPSPMLTAARLARNTHGAGQDIKCVFIGPCVAKKSEAIREGQGLVDAVLTFEELAAILVAAGINLAQIGGDALSSCQGASLDGMGFCSAGGVASAVKKCTAFSASDTPPEMLSLSGVENCMKALRQVSKGGLKADFVEGMACERGCIGGPGTLVDADVSARALQKLFKAKGEDASGH